MSSKGKNNQIKCDENLMIASKILDRNSSTPNLIKVEDEENNNNLGQIDFNKEHNSLYFINSSFYSWKY